jgi:NADH:ubiquinone oxidoreductase subunit 5 (subunit L)/multisubunit Na+/H+ antiporter MnhA subunit
METYRAAVQQVHQVGWLRLIPLLPLIGAAINGLAGRWLQARLGKRAVGGVAIVAMLGATALAVAALMELRALPPAGRYLLDRTLPLLAIGKLHADLAFAVDPLSAVMLLVITVVGSLIHIYSVGYMAGEGAYWRFFAYLNLFVFAMLLLVLGDNFLLLFFGWEGVGLCSYLLIGFWYQDRNSARAGMKAFVVNRVGDWGFLVGLALLFWGLGGSWSRLDHRYYPDALAGAAPSIVTVTPTDTPDSTQPSAARGVHQTVALGPTLLFRELHDQLAVTARDGSRPFADLLLSKTLWGAPLLLLVTLCLLLGAAGKSAQLPLHVWLPDAMAGPTPVSALIHAATMVTAGVYLIARLNFLFVLSPGAMTVVACIGALTALLAAAVALVQFDIKRVLAYSTISQLGFMFVAVGVGAWWAAVFHLVTHACFKACLFLGAGSLIHGTHRLTQGREHAPAHHPRAAADPRDPQDLRNMGGLGTIMPLTRWTYLIACWAIAGFPFAAGFFSKDEILWRAFASRATLLPGAVWWSALVLAAACTSLYVFRSYYLAFFGRAPSAQQRRTVHESPRSMTVVLVVLACLCLGVGWLAPPAAIFGQLPLFATWLEPVTNLSDASFAGTRAWLEGRGLELGILLGSLGAALLGWLVARALYRDLDASEPKLAAWRTRYAALHALVFDKFRIDELYAATWLRAFATLTRAADWLDRHVIDGVVHALAATARGAAGLSGVLDRYLVDGAVNGVAEATLAGGRALRRVQTGRINNYVLGIALGVVILVLMASWR